MKKVDNFHFFLNFSLRSTSQHYVHLAENLKSFQKKDHENLSGVLVKPLYLFNLQIADKILKNALEITTSESNKR